MCFVFLDIWFLENVIEFFFLTNFFPSIVKNSFIDGGKLISKGPLISVYYNTNDSSKSIYEKKKSKKHPREKEKK